MGSKKGYADELFDLTDRVVLVTRKAGAHIGVRWESTGEGTYTISEEPDAPQGTSVTLHLKPEDTERVKRRLAAVGWPVSDPFGSPE